jgi:hypothetical protein
VRIREVDIRHRLWGLSASARNSVIYRTEMTPGQDIHNSVPEYRTHHRPGYCGSNSPRSASPNRDCLPTLRVLNRRIACLRLKKKGLHNRNVPDVDLVASVTSLVERSMSLCIFKMHCCTTSLDNDHDLRQHHNLIQLATQLAASCDFSLSLNIADLINCSIAICRLLGIAVKTQVTVASYGSS